MLEVKMKWQGGIKFEGISAFGHKIATDGTEKAGGQREGYKPTELVLYALAGCTGVDVVRILEKMKQELTGFDIEIQGFQPDEYPKPFNKINVRYIFTGKGLNKNKVEKAVNLSEDKYCMVSQSLQGVAKLNTEIIIREA